MLMVLVLSFLHLLLKMVSVCLTRPILMQSHALCFYEDTIFAILVWFLVNVIGKDMLPEADVTLMTRLAFATFVHGAAHVSEAYRNYTADPEDVIGKEGNIFKPLSIIKGLVFWLTFMWVIHPEHTISKKLLRGVFWTTVGLFVPRLYGF